MRTSLALLAVVATLGVGLPAAHAATEAPRGVPRAATGAACTIVGTSSADVLTGTSHADVICGLGGNDTIKGLGGNDVIDAGSGNDTVSGGTGGDTIVGGSGNDRIAGGEGADHVAAGTGNDTVSGGAGTDHIDGAAGADHVDGGSGADVVAGGAGADQVTGSTGDDHVSGGSGDDSVSGGDGADVVNGDDGNDGLNGGDGPDVDNGGVGDDTCAFDAEDKSFVSCVYDTKAPVIGSLVLDQTSVDVTAAAVELGFTVHIRDDSQVSYVNVGANDTNGSFISDWDATLVSGTTHDGVWGGKLTIPRWAAEGEDPIEVLATDRVGRVTSTKTGATVTVVDANPDLALPQVVTASATPQVGAFPLDSAAGDQVVDVTAHFTDDGSGVKAPSACLVVPVGAPDATMPCAQMALTSGTTLDGDWSASVTLPAGSAPGDWGLLLRVWDVAHFGQKFEDFLAAPQFAAACPSGCDGRFALADGVGVIPVVNAAGIVVPSLASVTLSTSSVDTSATDAVVDVDVHALDASPNGLSSVIVAFYPGLGTGVQPQQNSAVAPTSGDRHDGVWHVPVTLPQGLPPGIYTVYVQLNSTQSARFVAPSSYLVGPDAVALTGAQLGASDGTVTVIDVTAP